MVKNLRVTLFTRMRGRAVPIVDNFTIRLPMLEGSTCNSWYMKPNKGLPAWGSTATPETHPIKSGLPHMRGSTPSSSALGNGLFRLPRMRGSTSTAIALSNPVYPAWDRLFIVTPERCPKFTACGDRPGPNPSAKTLVFTPHAGIDPFVTASSRHVSVTPHAGSTPPLGSWAGVRVCHMRGSTFSGRAVEVVYPCGIDLLISLQFFICLPMRGSTSIFNISWSSVCLLHVRSTQRQERIQPVPGFTRMRGDRPLRPKPKKPLFPHARGSTWIGLCLRLQAPVYPACAGIDLRFFIPKLLRIGLPRMRGDRPLTAHGAPVLSVFTPHARGST